ncbi:hypothetical protein J5N97_027974 [Dioscorea zingiberensis]|uniref:Uncharacterized protein n=1 Tax=Dioscorea zingiberensis TaxID=325984 RepID=A0A9D5H4C7_9LILI|nr:hypothetical protein J5N97_027974 [Dioscorea zingiberensis]
MPRDLVSGEEITADEIFSDGRNRPAFPLFGREVEPAGTGAEVVIPMQGLAIKDRDGIAESASSSECDELEGGSGKELLRLGAGAAGEEQFVVRVAAVADS